MTTPDAGPPAPTRAPVLTFVPGAWLAVVSDDLALLLDVTPSHPVLGACWNAAARGIGVDGVLAALAQAGGITDFALVGATGDGGTRVVVSGSARVELAGPQPAVLSATDGPRDERFGGRLAVRLAGPDTAGPAGPGAALPVVKAIVPAAAVGRGVDAATPVAVPPPAAPAPPTPAREPVAVPPVGNDTMPPSNFDSGLIDSLPWRTPPSFDTGDAPEPPAQPEPAPAPPPAAPQSWGATADADNPWAGYAAPGPPPMSSPPGPPPMSSPPGPPPMSSPPGPPPMSSPPPDNPWAPRTSQTPQTPQAAPAPPAPAGPPAGPPAPSTDPTPAPPSGNGGVPTVHAFACPRQHLNPPSASTCRVCGEPIPPQEGFLAPRPSLGVLRLSTGDTVPLDRDVVLGRAPFHADESSASRPHLVQLASPDNDISRSHLRVNLENWFVQVTDLDSTNGTVVTLPDQAPVRLRPHDPFTILPGTVVNIADEVTLRYELS
ncbi:FHA domain-containing protein [Jatrophihabitans fulvus]